MPTSVTTHEPSAAHEKLMAEAHCLDMERDALDQAMVANARLNRLKLASVLSLRFEDNLTHRANDRVFDYLLRRVCEELGEPGIPVDVPLAAIDDIGRRFLPATGDYRKQPPLNAVTVMAALLERIEPQAGALFVAQQAQALYDSLVRYTPPRIVGGRTVLTHNAWLDSFSSIGPAYSFDTQRRLAATFRYIASMLPQLDADYDPEEADLAYTECVHAFESNRWQVSRQFRVDLGPIELKLFQKKVEFWLPAPVANALNMFISLHVSMKQAA